MAKEASGLTVLEKALIYHNIIAITYVYENISFKRISIILNLSVDKILKIIHTMVNEKRVKAKID